MYRHERQNCFLFFSAQRSPYPQSSNYGIEAAAKVGHESYQIPNLVVKAQGWYNPQPFCYSSLSPLGTEVAIFHL